MNEVVHRQAQGMDSPALEDCHAVLNPQQGLVGCELRQQETHPAGIARMHREQFRKGRTWWDRQCKPPLDMFEGSWITRSLVLLSWRTKGGFDRTAPAAGDQGKTCNHTTHNALCSTFVLFPATLPQESMARLGWTF